MCVTAKWNAHTTHLQAANLVVRNVVLLHEGVHHGQADAVNVFQFCAHRHVGLSQALGVFSGTDTIVRLVVGVRHVKSINTQTTRATTSSPIVYLEISLGHVLVGEVRLSSNDTNIGGCLWG